MSKTIVVLAVASATLFAAGAASAHGRNFNNQHNQGHDQGHNHAGPVLAAGVGAKVAPLGTALGVGAAVGGRGGLLNVQTGLHTPLANIGLGVQAGGRGGELLSLDLGAFSGGVGR